MTGGNRMSLATPQRRRRPATAMPRTAVIVRRDACRVASTVAFSVPLPGSRMLRGLLSRVRQGVSGRRKRTPMSGGNGRFPARLTASALGGVVMHAQAEGERTRVLLLISDTGGGHRASADALSAAFHELYPGRVETRIVDFWTEIAGRPFDKFPEGYSFLAKNPPLWRAAWNYGRFPPTRFVTEQFANVVANRNFRAALTAFRPHLIVSVHPLTQFIPLRVLRALPRSERPTFVTVCTDLGGAHPTWFHRDADLVFVPTHDVRRIALRCGVHPGRVRLLGLPVRRAFWSAPESDKAALREALGIDPAIPTALVVGGGDGVGGVARIADALARRARARLGPEGAQIIVVCGRNARLAAKLHATRFPVPVRVEGFVTNMSDWMAASDLIVSKAGPGTIAEALIRGLPIVLSGFLPGQEAPNVKYVTANGVGEFSRDPVVIARIAVSWLADPDALRRRSETAKKLGRPSSSYDIVREIGRHVRLQGETMLKAPVV